MTTGLVEGWLLNIAETVWDHLDRERKKSGELFLKTTERNDRKLVKVGSG